ncbi:TIGR02452 family protein [Paenibacillus sp. PR3]|uniref:TIGR02452 family protein n=1 Tax=Paenibacillus terricola TaxID=2763503 RepID=A0ABR8MR17_9BACL|nr:TIGR02452 family protein [Paenibacillus terricola]MBD3918433.1 TIGR02452 family protein [Paenibacillus terricola]
MNRKEIAQETLRIQQQGYYDYQGLRIDIAESQRYSEHNSQLITPEEGNDWLRDFQPSGQNSQAQCAVSNEATVKALLNYANDRIGQVGVLNFASAKNPGGGFLNGAMAQEESLAASSGLYGTLLTHPSYYDSNRAFRSMMYTDHAIYSPEVVFFRDERFNLIKKPVAASVLTLPAVNYGQVLLKGEDSQLAERVMKNRMRLALAIFAHFGNKHLVLGAYGCGVFRNDPATIARWWHELLNDEGYGTYFTEIRFAVLDSKDGKCIRAFEQQFVR